MSHYIICISSSDNEEDTSKKESKNIKCSKKHESKLTFPKKRKLSLNVQKENVVKRQKILKNRMVLLNTKNCNEICSDAIIENFENQQSNKVKRLKTSNNSSSNCSSNFEISTKLNQIKSRSSVKSEFVMQPNNEFLSQTDSLKQSHSSRKVVKPILVIKEKVSIPDVEDNIFAKFIETCLKIRSDDITKKILNKLKKRYKKLDPDDVNNERFRLFLNDMDEKILKNHGEKFYTYIQEVNNEIKQYTSKSNISKSEETNCNISRNQSYQTNIDEKIILEPDNQLSKDNIEKVKKLEKAIKKCQQKIEELEAQEVDFDDEENSTYIKEDRYKRKLIELYAMLTKIVGDDTIKREIYRKKLKRNDISGEMTGIASIDKAIIDFVNVSIKKVNKLKHIKNHNKIADFLSVPDYEDILQCIYNCNIKQNFGFDKTKVEQLALTTLQSLGKCLKKQRLCDSKNYILSYLGTEEQDPAIKNNELNNKLQQSKEQGERKLEEIFRKYVKKEEELYLKNQKQQLLESPTINYKNKYKIVKDKNDEKEDKTSNIDVHDKVETSQEKEKDPDEKSILHQEKNNYSIKKNCVHHDKEKDLHEESELLEDKEGDSHEKNNENKKRNSFKENNDSKKQDSHKETNENKEPDTYKKNYENKKQESHKDNYENKKQDSHKETNENKERDSFKENNDGKKQDSCKENKENKKQGSCKETNENKEAESCKENYKNKKQESDKDNYENKKQDSHKETNENKELDTYKKNYENKKQESHKKNNENKERDSFKENNDSKTQDSCKENKENKKQDSCKETNENKEAESCKENYENKKQESHKDNYENKKQELHKDNCENKKQESRKETSENKEPDSYEDNYENKKQNSHKETNKNKEPDSYEDNYEDKKQESHKETSENKEPDSYEDNFEDQNQESHKEISENKELDSCKENYEDKKQDSHKETNENKEPDLYKENYEDKKQESHKETSENEKWNLHEKNELCEVKEQDVYENIIVHQVEETIAIPKLENDTYNFSNNQDLQNTCYNFEFNTIKQESKNNKGNDIICQKQKSLKNNLDEKIPVNSFVSNQMYNTNIISKNYNAGILFKTSEICDISNNLKNSDKNILLATVCEEVEISSDEDEVALNNKLNIETKENTIFINNNDCITDDIAVELNTNLISKEVNILRNDCNSNYNNNKSDSNDSSDQVTSNVNKVLEEENVDVTYPSSTIKVDNMLQTENNNVSIYNYRTVEKLNKSDVSKEIKNLKESMETVELVEETEVSKTYNEIDQNVQGTNIIIETKITHDQKPLDINSPEKCTTKKFSSYIKVRSFAKPPDSWKDSLSPEKTKQNISMPVQQVLTDVSVPECVDLTVEKIHRLPSTSTRIDPYAFNTNETPVSNVVVVRNIINNYRVPVSHNEIKGTKVAVSRNVHVIDPQTLENVSYLPKKSNVVMNQFPINNLNQNSSTLSTNIITRSRMTVMLKKKNDT